MKLSLCILGCGNFAKTFARAMAYMKDEVELFFASRDLGRAEQYAEAYGGSGAFGSYEEAAADPRVQAVYICTPHHLHREHAVMAARAGKHVLVEKPIALTLEDARDMVSEAREAGVAFMVAENYRYMSGVLKAREIIDSGALGDLRLVQLQEEAAMVPGDWRGRRSSSGGGVLIDGGIHKVDILVYLSGMPSQVFASSLPTGPSALEVENGVVIMTKTADGVVGVINHAWTAAKSPGPQWVSVSGLHGRLYFEMGAFRLASDDGEEQLTLRWDDGGEQRTLALEPDHYGLVPMIREFRSSILEGREPLTSGAAGIQALSVVLKAYESMERGVSLEVE